MDLIEANMDTKQTRDKPQMKIDYIRIRNRLKHNIECMIVSFMGLKNCIHSVC